MCVCLSVCICVCVHVCMSLCVCVCIPCICTCMANIKSSPQLLSLILFETGSLTAPEAYWFSCKVPGSLQSPPRQCWDCQCVWMQTRENASALCVTVYMCGEGGYMCLYKCVYVNEWAFGCMCVMCECKSHDRVYLYWFNISIKLASFQYSIVLIDLLIMQTMQMDYGFLMLIFEWFFS